MPKIEIAFDLPSFKYAFVWTATEAEAAALFDQQLALIAESGLDPAVLNAVVVQVPAILQASANAASIDGAHVMLSAWVLQQDARHPECPGRVIDYLPTHDFKVTITKVESGAIDAVIKARARDDFDGSA